MQCLDDYKIAQHASEIDMHASMNMDFKIWTRMVCGYLDLNRFANYVWKVVIGLTKWDLDNMDNWIIIGYGHGFKKWIRKLVLR